MYARYSSSKNKECHCILVYMMINWSKSDSGHASSIRPFVETHWLNQIAFSNTFLETIKNKYVAKLNKRSTIVLFLITGLVCGVRRNPLMKLNGIIHKPRSKLLSSSRILNVFLKKKMYQVTSLNNRMMKCSLKASNCEDVEASGRWRAG